MDILNIFRKKQNEDVRKQTYACKLDKILAENNIPYDIEEENEIVIIDYINPFDNMVFEFKNINNKIYLDNKELDLETAFKIIKKQWDNDKLLIKYLEDERYSPIFEIENFFKDITSKEGLIGLFFPRKDNKGIKLLYTIGKTPEENDYITGVEFILTNDKVKCKKLPEYTDATPSGSVIHILNKIYQEVPLFFTSGNYKVKENTMFTDVIKTYLVNLAIVNRLNEIQNIEAQITNPETADIVFVMFENGSAIEYMSPTIQNPNGKYLLIDFDDDNTVEDNESYDNVSKILKLPTLLNDKPNENNMPIRNFSKNENRRFK